MTDRCPGRRCRRSAPRSHSLTSVHNSRVLLLRGLSGTNIQEVLNWLRREAAERPLRPVVCRRYNTRDGCPTGDCLQLHCCFYFARDDCAYGESCRLDHRLKSRHNQRVLRFFDLDEASALLAVREELGGAGTGTAPAGPPAAADAEVERAELRRDAEAARLLDHQDQLEQTLRTVVRLNSETEQELVSSRRAGRVLQVEAEHASLVAQERERQDSSDLQAVKHDSLELSLLAAAESSERLESAVSVLNTKLSVLEVDYQRSRQEQQRLAAALEQERRLQRGQQEQRERELERTLAYICLEECECQLPRTPPDPPDSWLTARPGPIRRLTNHSPESTGRVANRSTESTARLANHSPESTGRLANHSTESTGRLANHSHESTVRLANRSPGSTGQLANHFPGSTGRLANRSSGSTGRLANHFPGSTGRLPIHFPGSTGRLANRSTESTGRLANRSPDPPDDWLITPPNPPDDCITTSWDP